jgi:putative PIN family toxin of toxin-antitoxin system
VIGDRERAVRVVVDSNVWLDLLLFDDPRAARLRAALEDGGVFAVANAALRAEWQRVLGYPVFAIGAQRQRALLAAFDARVLRVDDEAARDDAAVLPRCADPDDQMFVALAHDAGARALISRDAALLALRRRTRRLGFDVVTPEGFDPSLLLD